MSLDQFFDNQRLWQERITLGTGGTARWIGEVWAGASGAWLHLMPGDSGGSRAANEIPSEVAAVVASEVAEVVAGVVAGPLVTGVTEAIVWARRPDADLDLELLADGWRAGFEPWWMIADLTDLPDSPALPAGIEIRPGEADDAEALVPDVPYAYADQLALCARRPDGLEWWVATDGGRPIGHAVANLGLPHVDGAGSGLFNVGVHPSHRRRGVGLALTLAAMRSAREAGAAWMGLNSTGMGKHVYEQAGFRQIGVGQTWLRSSDRLTDNPPDDHRALLRAIGSGEVGAVGGELPERFWCDLSAQQVAARFGQTEMLAHLVAPTSEGGVDLVPDVVALWSAGLTDEATAACADPDARELVTQPWDARPLHHATAAGNGGLVRALLAHGADLTATDSQFGGTPLGWAEATGQPGIAALIRAATGA